MLLALFGLLFLFHMRVFFLHLLRCLSLVAIQLIIIAEGSAYRRAQGDPAASHEAAATPTSTDGFGPSMPINTAIATSRSIAAAATLSGSGTINNNSTLPTPTATVRGNPFAGKPTSASYSNNIPPAYLTWKKPVPNQTFPPLFKVGASNISFEWTVDPGMLKVQPANLTVALVGPQKQTFTAAIVAGTATSAHWSVAAIPSNSPLMMGYYTVWVYDQRGPRAYPSPGWLMPDSRLVVAMYSTEAYVGRTDSMFCPTCYLGASGTSLRDAIAPWLMATGITLVSSVSVLWTLVR